MTHLRLIHRFPGLFLEEGAGEQLWREKKSLWKRIVIPFPLFEKQIDKAGSKRHNSNVWGIHPDTFMQAD